MEAAKQSKAGRRRDYDEPKVPAAFGMTKSALQGLDSLAKEFGLSRSELMERIGRGAFLIVPKQSQSDEMSFPEAS